MEEYTQAMKRIFLLELAEFTQLRLTLNQP
jgi:hypothetical protein